MMALLRSKPLRQRSERQARFERELSTAKTEILGRARYACELCGDRSARLDAHRGKIEYKTWPRVMRLTGAVTSPVWRTDMAKRTCSVDGCGHPAIARGWCGTHWRQWRQGRPVGEDRPYGLDNFWSKVDKNGAIPSVMPDLGACWMWLGYAQKGYPIWTTRVDGQNHHHRAHRFAYELLVGPIPEGLTLDHLCKVTRCVNPAHLDPCTAGENSLRGDGPLARLARATHCKYGHEWDAKNTRRGKDGARECRACAAARARAWRATRKAAR